MSWECVIGLEVHVQLKTASKLFCACSTAFGDPPNSNVCPVCLGLPGALPVLNREAVRMGVQAAKALDCTVNAQSVFARKNYFYPDLPKGYQISQFDTPLAVGGSLAIDSPDRGGVAIGLTRLHLEEDAGKSIHDRYPERTAIDLNRSGVPLIEIVSEPEIRSPQEARVYLVTLKQLLEYIAVSDCSMEEGSLRVDANLSVRPVGQITLGTKQEVKNMNSFAMAERALSALRQRQIDLLQRGRPVTLTTYSASTGELSPMRGKEESHDYRYFPDPDLLALSLSDRGLSPADILLPELPRVRRARFVTDYGLSEYDAGVLTATRSLAEYFEEVLRAGAPADQAAAWVINDALSLTDDARPTIDPSRLAETIALVADGTVSRQAGKRVLAELAREGTTSGSPRVIAEELGVLQVSNESAIARWVDKVLAAHPGERQRYREGERQLFGFFMGRAMRESGGKADPTKVRSALQDRLG